MILTVNGESMTFPGEHLASLLDHLELAGKPCAVEINQQLVPAREHADRILSDGDVVEILTLVGGG